MANGTIAFDTLQTSGQITGTAKSVDTDYVVNGSAKAFVNGQTDTTLNNSFNISTNTDSGTGLYTYGITNAFTTEIDLNCSTAGVAIGDAIFIRINGDNTTSSAIRIHCVNTSASNTDSLHCFQITGDLA